MVIAVCICFAIVIVAVMACIWTASDYDREEEKEDD
jgi:hypothetical protein